MQPQTSFDLSSGLNALLQNKVERPAKKANIPAGMQALIQAQQILRQQAKPTTPDGQPTVASQVEQAISQEMQPSGPGMMPADAFREQLMKTLQMRAQQQMAGQPPQQPPQEPAQQASAQQPPQEQLPIQLPPPQSMARGGIARLSADNMARLAQYSTGGVIGFSGVTASDVQDPLVTQTSDTALLKLETEKAEKARELADKYKKSLSVMSSVANSGDQQAIQKYAGFTQQNLDNLKQYVSSAYGNKSEQALNTLLSSSTPAPIKSSPSEEMAKQEAARLLRSHPAPEWNIDSLVGKGNIASPAKTVAKPQASQVPSPTTSREGIMAGIPIPTSEEAFRAAKKDVPQPEEIAALRSTADERRALQKQRPDVEGMGIAALEKYEQARLGQLEKERGSDFLRKLSAFGRDLYERGEKDRTGGIADAIAARDRENNRAELTAQELKLKLMDAAHQKKVNDLDAYAKSMQDIATLKNQYSNAVTNAAQINAGISEKVFQGQTSAATQAAHNAVQMQIAREGNALRASELALNREDLKQRSGESLLNRINEAITLKTEKAKEDILKNRPMLKMQLDMGGMPNATEDQKRQAIQASQELANEMKAIIAPLMQQREQIMAKLNPFDPKLFSNFSVK